jgi:hypothetical protein
VIPITNVDVSYKVVKARALSGGAINVVNRHPDRVNRAARAVLQPGCAIECGGGAALHVTHRV